MTDDLPARPRSVALLGAGGTMGKGMARNLASAGFEVRAWDRSFAKLADREGGGRRLPQAGRRRGC